MIIVTHDKNSGNSTKKTRRDGYCDEHDIYLNPRTKRTKLKSIAVKKKAPSRPSYLESSHSQGGIVRSDPSTEVEEVEILATPKKADVEIIDVDAETYDLERMKKDLASKSVENCKIIQSYLFLYEFDHATKMKELQFNVQICDQLYIALLAGFERGKNGELWLERVLSSTKRAQTCIFKGINTYQNHHGENTIEALAHQKLCTTSIGSDEKIKQLFDCLPPLECMIKIFKAKHLGVKENCVYDFKLKCIDILRQSSTGVHGGKECLFRIHRDNMEGRQKVVVSVIFQLNAVKSAMKIVGGDVFKYTKVGQGVKFLSALWHESIFADQGTIKIALFFEGSAKLKKVVTEERERVEARWNVDKKSAQV